MKKNADDKTNPLRVEADGKWAYAQQQWLKA